MPKHPVPSDGQILALLERHGFPSDRVEASPYEGSGNHVRMAGGLCVRVLKEEDYASDITTEAVSVPAVRKAGVATPELLVFDDSRDIVPGLVTIYRRVPGIPLGRCGPLENPEGMVREIGRQIALWQTGLTEVSDPNGWLDKPRHNDAWKSYERNAERLSPRERIWAEAGWGDPTLNVHCLPAAWLPLLLEPLGAVSQDYVGRCLYGILAYALNDVHRPEREASPYGHTGHQRWQSLQTLAAQRLPDDWRHWIADGPPMG
ncbi:hypothetical protein BH11ARM2_BH11ARM2_37880 [soil metagenome]